MKIPRRVSVLVVLGMLVGMILLAPVSVTAQFTEIELTASDAAGGDHFGWSVSIDGDTIVVGARLAPARINDPGVVYVFQRSGTTWSQQADLTASDGVDGDSFGYSVSINGDTIVVGARSDDECVLPFPVTCESGSAYVFHRSGTIWTQQAKLISSDRAQGDWFGESVSIDGDTAVIGARSDDASGVNSGSAYVFQRIGITWTQQTKLIPSDGRANDVFGRTVSISGDTIVVGAFLDDDAPICTTLPNPNDCESGSAYVFQRSGNTWSQQSKLTASDAASGDLFGDSVSISGDTIVVGARLDDDPGSLCNFPRDPGCNKGSAYVYRRSGTAWTPEAKLTASDGRAIDFLGHVSAYGEGGGFPLVPVRKKKNS